MRGWVRFQNCVALASVLVLGGCEPKAGPDDAGRTPVGDVPDPMTRPDGAPDAGNPMGGCEVPAEAQLEDVSSPTTVVGDGTPQSCTGDAFVSAVARGGVITFNCGPDPVTITLTRTAKVVNNTGPRIVIDG